MIDTVPKPDANLAEFLTSRARHASDKRLAANGMAGLVAATAAAVWGGPAWYVFCSFATCFLAYGVWGIVDRELGECSAGKRSALLTLRLVRALAAVLGFTAAVFTMFAALGVALGTIIS